MMPRSHQVVVALAIAIVGSSTASAASVARVCYPGYSIPAVPIPAVTIPAVTIPAVTIPAVTIPAVCVGGTCYPAQHYPAQHYPAQHYPAQHYPAQTIPGRTVPGRCFEASKSYAAFAPTRTTVRIRNYDEVDRSYSSKLSSRYWERAGSKASYPNAYATGFGGFNAAGFPKNQFVRSYFRRDGTFVSGYWRNSPSDGLPTCRIIHC